MRNSLVLELQPHLLSRCCLHVQEEVEQGPDQAGGLGFADGVQEGPDVLQESSQLCKKPQIMKHNPPSQELHCAGAAPHHTHQQDLSHQTFPRWFLSIIHGTEQQMSPAGQPCSKQGLQRDWGLQPHHSPACHCSSPLTHSCNCLRHVSKCKNLLNALRCFYKIRDGVYN